MEERLHRVKDVVLDNAPKLLIEESRYTIGTWSFIRAKKEGNVLNFYICDRNLQAEFHLLSKQGS